MPVNIDIPVASVRIIIFVSFNSLLRYMKKGILVEPNNIRAMLNNDFTSV